MFLFLCLLKKVEIVIINSNRRGNIEAKGFESFSKPAAHILCALFSCYIKFCFLVFIIHCLYDNYGNFWNKYCFITIGFFGVFIIITLYFRCLFKKRPPNCTNYIFKIKIDEKQDTKQAGCIRYGKNI